MQENKDSASQASAQCPDSVDGGETISAEQLNVCICYLTMLIISNDHSGNEQILKKIYCLQDKEHLQSSADCSESSSQEVVCT